MLCSPMHITHVQVRGCAYPGTGIMPRKPKRTAHAPVLCSPWAHAPTHIHTLARARVGPHTREVACTCAPQRLPVGGHNVLLVCVHDERALRSPVVVLQAVSAPTVPPHHQPMLYTAWRICSTPCFTTNYGEWSGTQAAKRRAPSVFKSRAPLSLTAGPILALPGMHCCPRLEGE